MFDFPASPSLGQPFVIAGITYVWDGIAWNVVAAPNLAPLTAQARNRIVNGAMQISQELGKGNTNSTLNGYPADQWLCYWSTTGVPAQGHRQDTTPARADVDWFFRFSASTADTSLAATEYYLAAQRIEGINIADFKWGTPQAVPAVIRLLARSVIAGTFCVSIRAGVADASFVKNCTITTPNVWTLFTIPVPACTIGTWAIDTSQGMNINVCAAAGTNYNTGTDGVWSAGAAIATPAQTNWLSAASQYLEFTNVGLHLDPLNTGIAPPWQMPNEADELIRCKRYFQPIAGFLGGYASGVITLGVAMNLPVTMRATPTYAVGSTSNNNCTGSVIAASSPSRADLNASGAVAGGFISASAGNLIARM
jgi:hypothetical protein